MKDDVTVDAARAEATVEARRLKQQYGDGTAMTDVAVIPLRDELVGRVRPVLFLLLASVVLLLGVASANLATLLLARISTRRRELAVRTALGGKGTSLLVPIVAESLIIAIAGGLAGLLVARAGIQAIRLLDPRHPATLDRHRCERDGVGLRASCDGPHALLFATLAGWHARRLDLAAGRRFALGVTVAFAGAAMLVAILGVYGVLSYLVSQRSQEFGVRIALGAQWTDIQRLVFGEAGRLVVLGLRQPISA